MAPAIRLRSIDIIPDSFLPAITLRVAGKIRSQLIFNKRFLFF